jgi:hypothetical protein
MEVDGALVPTIGFWVGDTVGSLVGVGIPSQHMT